MLNCAIKFYTSLKIFLICDYLVGSVFIIISLFCKYFMFLILKISVL